MADPWSTSVNDDILASYADAEMSRRVLVVRRADGLYSYRLQWAEQLDGQVAWGGPGPYCGLYDSQETAEAEALGRVVWFKVG